MLFAPAKGSVEVPGPVTVPGNHVNRVLNERSGRQIHRISEGFVRREINGRTNVRSGNA